MTNEREILEACAKVMGCELSSTGKIPWTSSDGLATGWKEWNPLHSLADAASMAVKMKVDVCWQTLLECVQCNYAPAHGDDGFISVRAYFKDHPTEEAAYCWAVCQVVAQLGELK